MTTDTPKTVYLADYRPPPFLIEHADLHFELGEETTLVTAALAIERNPDFGTDAGDLRLDGQDLELVSVAIDGTPLGNVRRALKRRKAGRTAYSGESVRRRLSAMIRTITASSAGTAYWSV